MTRLSVNINKIATLRNARGGNIPDLCKMATDIQRYGAQGITIHPRPDERHIKRSDVFELKPIVNTEFNIEGYPDEDFIQLVLEAKPDQVTLVPDLPTAKTSNVGWDTKTNVDFLTKTIHIFQKAGIRTSVFVSPDLELVEYAAKTKTNRIELYTEAYATEFFISPEEAVKPYILAAELAKSLGMDINAGHDLNLDNLAYLKLKIPFMAEVSIGHALISDALYYGIENTIQMYLRCLK